MNHYVFFSVMLMALVTYLIRVLPMLSFKKRIENRYIQSFLEYVPFAVLSAMTFPDIFTSTNSLISGVLGCLVAIFLAYRGKGLVVVAICAVVCVYLSELFFVTF